MERGSVKHPPCSFDPRATTQPRSRPRPQPRSKNTAAATSSSSPPRTSTSAPGPSVTRKKRTSSPFWPKGTCSETWCGRREGRVRAAPRWPRGCGTCGELSTPTFPSPWSGPRSSRARAPTRRSLSSGLSGEPSRAGPTLPAASPSSTSTPPLRRKLSGPPSTAR